MDEQESQLECSLSAEQSLVLPAYDFALLNKAGEELPILQSGLKGGDELEHLSGKSSFENRLPLRELESILARNPLRSKVPKGGIFLV